jgi:hypothetical protein
MKRNWSVEDVTDRLEQAFKTLRNMPDKERRFLSARSNWPDYVRKYYEGGIDYKSVPKIRLVPSAEDITKMDEALEWLRWITKCRHRDTATLGRIVWARAEGFSWREISWMCTPERDRKHNRKTISHVTCVGWYKIGIVYITDRLNRTNAKKRS